MPVGVVFFFNSVDGGLEEAPLPTEDDGFYRNILIELSSRGGISYPAKQSPGVWEMVSLCFCECFPGMTVSI